MTLLYLAGPITGTAYADSNGWRGYVASKLHPSIEPISPMRDKEYLSQEESIAASYEDSLFSNQRTFTMRDEFDVRRADAVLVNFLDAQKVSIGTVLEIGLARGLEVPVIVVDEDGCHNHPMLRQFASTVVTNLDDGIAVVNWMLKTGV